MKELLRNAGYKATPGRLALLEFLRKSKKPMSVAKIVHGLRGKKIDQVTAYRAIEALEKIGLVRKVDLRHGHADYEFAADDHHHLICAQCGRIEDFQDCGSDILARKILRKSKVFSKINRHSLEFFGTCKACADKKA